jgi:hypothetical protein
MKTHKSIPQEYIPVIPLFIKVTEDAKDLFITQDIGNSNEFWINIYEKKMSLGFGVSEKYLLELYNKLKERFEDKNVTFDI